MTTTTIVIPRLPPTIEQEIAAWTFKDVFTVGGIFMAFMAAMAVLAAWLFWRYRKEQRLLTEQHIAELKAYNDTISEETTFWRSKSESLIRELCELKGEIARLQERMSSLERISSGHCMFLKFGEDGGCIYCSHPEAWARLAVLSLDAPEEEGVMD